VKVRVLSAAPAVIFPKEHWVVFSESYFCDEVNGL